MVRRVLAVHKLPWRRSRVDTLDLEVAKHKFSQIQKQTKRELKAVPLLEIS